MEREGGIGKRAEQDTTTNPAGSHETTTDIPRPNEDEAQDSLTCLNRQVASLWWQAARLGLDVPATILNSKTVRAYLGETGARDFTRFWKRFQREAQSSLDSEEPSPKLYKEAEKHLMRFWRLLDMELSPREKEKEEAEKNLIRFSRLLDMEPSPKEEGG